MHALFAILAVLLLAGRAAAAPTVIASVMPVHAIVAAVMGDLGEPDLLLSGQMSEHRASFTPAQVAALGEADLVFIVGQGLEAKLAQLSGSETVNGKAFVQLSEAPGVNKLAIREGGAWEPDTDEMAVQPAAEGVLSSDPHVWLDPENAKAMAAAVAIELGKADPANAGTYAANASAFAAKLDTVEAELSATIAPVKTRPYIVFHDAYHYFERRFGLNAVGSISDVAARTPSAERLKELRDKLAQTGAVCVFREPQFDDKVVNTIIEGSTARAATLDPLGATLDPGPGAYPQLLRNLANDLAGCLAG